MTPAITLVRRAKIPFHVHQYEHRSDAESYGQEAADKLGIEPGRVFKTLVVMDEKSRLAVAVLPVSGQLDLKCMANALKAKKVAMANPQDVERSTGYVLGGVSPLAQKKRLPTVIDSTAMQFDSIFVSAGRRGLEIELAAESLGQLTDAQFNSIIK